MSQAAAWCKVNCQMSHNSRCQKLVLHSVPIQVNQKIHHQHMCFQLVPHCQRQQSEGPNSWCSEVTLPMNQERFKSVLQCKLHWGHNSDEPREVQDLIFDGPHLKSEPIGFCMHKTSHSGNSKFSQTHAIGTCMHTSGFVACSHCVDSLCATCWSFFMCTYTLCNVHSKKCSNVSCALCMHACNEVI